MEKLVVNYLRTLNIPVSTNYCTKLIASHPDYPSFLSIADTLQRMGINHRVARIEKDKLNHLPFPYLIQPEGVSKNGELRFIKDEDDLSALNTGFSSAIVLQAEPTGTVADPENERQRTLETFQRVMIGILLAALAGLLLLTSISNMSWMYGLLLLTALGGTVTGYLLIAKDLGITYDAVEAFCNAGQKTNCDRILHSEDAKIFGGITLSDAAASYFLFQTLMIGLFIPLSGGIASNYGILGSLNLVAIPVVAYSLYYQLVKAGTWCRLCLIVDGILIIQAGLFGYMYGEGIISLGSMSALPAVLTLFLFAVIGSGLVLVKSILEKAGKSEQKEVLANRVKYNPEVFTSLLFQQQKVDTTPFKKEMIIGNTEAPIRILIVASLGCGPCKDGFEKATQLVAAYQGEVNLAIRLGLGRGYNGLLAPGTQLLGWWLRHIHGHSDASARTEEMVRKWYDLMNPKKFRKQYPLKSEDRTAAEVETWKDQHSKWVDQADIKVTPTFLINNYLLPKQYTIEDLMWILPGLIDFFEQQEFRQKVVQTNEEIASTMTGRG